MIAVFTLDFLDMFLGMSHHSTLEVVTKPTEAGPAAFVLPGQICEISRNVRMLKVFFPQMFGFPFLAQKSLRTELTSVDVSR